MKFKSDTFDVEHRQIVNDNYLHILHVEQIDDKLKKLIDNYISRICYGDDDTDVSTVKKELIHLFESKKDDLNKLMGSIAEFIIEVYLTEIGFKQEFVFLNLEEGSAKKGFDGYFTYSGQEWIFESKSGNQDTKEISHYSKISEAYRDLKEKISTKADNNPWKNAYNHAKIVGSHTDIQKNLKKLSEDFINDKYQKIENFNIIPGSTIYLTNFWEKINANELERQIKTYFLKKTIKGLNVICVNKKTVDLFLNYLKS